MAYIVLDFEFNQAFDFVKGAPAEPHPNCRFEIIQIGAVKLNDELDIIDRCNFFIKPQLYKRVHPYVEKITGITTESLENERFFPEVFKDFFKFCSEGENDDNTVLCVWGTSDIKTLYRNMAFYKLSKEPILIKYIDIQALATAYLKYNKGTTIGLKNAADRLNLPSDEDRFHDALYDALYTAKIFKIVKPEKMTIKLFNSSHIITKNKKKNR